MTCPEGSLNEAAEVRGQSRLTGCPHRLKLSTVQESWQHAKVACEAKHTGETWSAEKRVLGTLDS